MADKKVGPVAKLQSPQFLVVKKMKRVNLKPRLPAILDGKAVVNGKKKR
jgi:hypothetical protein